VCSWSVSRSIVLLPSANRTAMSICCIAVGFIVVMILVSASMLRLVFAHLPRVLSVLRLMDTKCLQLLLNLIADTDLEYIFN
jgi:hypothetical protein